MALQRVGRAPWACAAITAIMLAGGPALAQQDPLAGVKTLPDQGQEHQNGPIDYGTSFPTSGPHSPTPIPPGFYTDRPPTESLVHSLEHGNIVIYYDQPGDAATAVLRGWVQQYQGTWDGVVVVRVRGIGPGIALTAWTKQLFQPGFDEDAAFAFVDAFRGRGPERAVR